MSALYQVRTVDAANSNALIAKHLLTFKRDGTKPAVVYAHGLGGSELEANYDATANYWYRASDSMARAGYPVITGNLGGQETWGNATATTQMSDCIAWARANVGAKATGKYFVSGGSMGGLAACNLARIDPTHIAGLILWDPDVMLQYSHDSLVPDESASVDAAYGGHAGYLAALATRDPVQYGPTELASIPILVFRNTNITGVSTQVANWCTAMAAVNNDFTVYTTASASVHSLVDFDVSVVKPWMDARA